MKIKATLELEVDGEKVEKTLSTVSLAPAQARQETAPTDDNHGDMHQLDVGGFEVYLPICKQDPGHSIKVGQTLVAYIFVVQDPLNTNIKTEHWALLDAYDPIPGSPPVYTPEKPLFLKAVNTWGTTNPTLFFSFLRNLANSGTNIRYIQAVCTSKPLPP